MNPNNENQIMFNTFPILFPEAPVLPSCKVNWKVSDNFFLCSDAQVSLTLKCWGSKTFLLCG